MNLGPFCRWTRDHRFWTVAKWLFTSSLLGIRVLFLVYDSIEYGRRIKVYSSAQMSMSKRPEAVFCAHISLFLWRFRLRGRKAAAILVHEFLLESSISSDKILDELFEVHIAPVVDFTCFEWCQGLSIYDNSLATLWSLIVPRIASSVHL